MNTAQYLRSYYSPFTKTFCLREVPSMITKRRAGCHVWEILGGSCFFDQQYPGPASLTRIGKFPLEHTYR
jgi:hypothetical protein